MGHEASSLYHVCREDPNTVMIKQSDSNTWLSGKRYKCKREVYGWKEAFALVEQLNKTKPGHHVATNQWTIRHEPGFKIFAQGPHTSETVEFVDEL